MNYVILVSDFSNHSENSISAFLFSQALLSAGHILKNVFFFYNGVFDANKMLILPSDRFNASLEWENLSNIHNIPLYVCSSASLERGIFSHNELKNIDHVKFVNLSSSFKFIGYTEWLLDVVQCDRLIQF
ncbi:sulfurtransferase complex subunit TusD [Buchnera aphidicola]|nr:sulfurtransferase complex subunit TusD [Buchnera aphidicola]